MGSHLKRTMLIATSLLLLGCSHSKPKYATSEDAEAAALNKPNPEGTYGQGVQAKEAMTVTAVLANPTAHEGQKIAVRGTVSDVCAMRGCWMDITDEAGKEIRIKVTDGDVVFPVSAKGHTVQAEGVLEKLELTAEQAREAQEHEAAEKGETFDPTSVQGPSTVWRIRGTGARIEAQPATSH